jgi:hypothetical protein
MSDLHRCTVCGVRHRHPKAHRVLTAFALAGAFIAVEIVAAIHLDGWLSFALWVLAAWNVLKVTVLVYGLATIAAERGAAS